MAGITSERFDPHHYLRLVWRWKWLLLAVLILIPVAVVALSLTATKTYEARTTLFVQTTNVSSSDSSDRVEVSTSSPESVARLVQTPLVADVAARELGEPEAGRTLLKKVSAVLDPALGANPESNFLTIAARDANPERAAEIAAAFAEAIATQREREAVRAIDASIESLSEQAPAIRGLGDSAKTDLAQELQQLRSLRASSQNATQVVDPVVVPEEQISPRPLRNTALAGILAFLIAAALIPLLDRLDRKLREPDELERLLSVPLLAQIPANAFPGRRAGPETREAFQTLRASLMSFNVDRSLDSIVVTSPIHGEGKSTVSAGLAVSLALDGRDTVLIDGDLRKGQLAARLGVEAPAGLGAVLLDDQPVQDALVEVPRVEGGRLRLLSASGAFPNASVLLGSDRMASLLLELKAAADIIIIDTPPLMVVSDAISMLEGVSGVLLVARVDYSTRDALRKSAKVVSQAKGNLLGVAASGARQTGLYGYGDYLAVEPENAGPPSSATNGANEGAATSGLRARITGVRSRN